MILKCAVPSPKYILYIIKVFSPTDAQLDSLKNNITFALN